MMIFSAATMLSFQQIRFNPIGRVEGGYNLNEVLKVSNKSDLTQSVGVGLPSLIQLRDVTVSNKSDLTQSVGFIPDSAQVSPDGFQQIRFNPIGRVDIKRSPKTRQLVWFPTNPI